MTRYRFHSSTLSLLCSLPLALATSGCGDDGSPASSGGDAGTGGGGAGGATGSAEFDACLADVETDCHVVDAQTAEEINRACMALTALAVPLSDGTYYGPMTVPGGPYGGKVDWNVGAGTEFVNPVNSSEPLCIPIGIQTFNEPAEVNQELFNTRDLDYSLYTIFRPACMKDGETYPVITWANGTCGLTHGYAPLLGALSSYGYVIIASNSSWTDTPPTDGVQARAIDYAEALNEDAESPLYHRLDLSKVGAMGHSQGASATANVATDERVKSLILFNGGASSERPFLNVSGDRDIGNTKTPATMASETDAASQPGAWLFYNQVLQTGGTSTGHLVLMEQPERVVEITVAWWDHWLKADADAKAKFVGSDCHFCTHPDEYDFGINAHFK